MTLNEQIESLKLGRECWARVMVGAPWVRGTVTAIGISPPLVAISCGAATITIVLRDVAETDLPCVVHGEKPIQNAGDAVAESTERLAAMQAEALVQKDAEIVARDAEIAMLRSALAALTGGAIEDQPAIGFALAPTIAEPIATVTEPPVSLTEPPVSVTEPPVTVDPNAPPQLRRQGLLGALDHLDAHAQIVDIYGTPVAWEVVIAAWGELRSEPVQIEGATLEEALVRAARELGWADRAAGELGDA